MPDSENVDDSLARIELSHASKKDKDFSVADMDDDDRVIARQVDVEVRNENINDHSGHARGPSADFERYGFSSV